ncbi:hypothetical protein K503DRAFT_784837, partial [Rhizopogon vinicolor AM-OR11-026]
MTRISADAFRDQIKNDPDSFTQFKVLRLTHIKDLANWVWHEYVQMIVRDTSNNKLHRILVERVTSNDNTEGEAPSSGNSDPWFPLPLLSVFFHTPLALSDVADHLCAIIICCGPIAIAYMQVQAALLRRSRGIGAATVEFRQLMPPSRIRLREVLSLSQRPCSKLTMIQAAPKFVIPVAKLTKISDMDNLNDVSDVDDIKDVTVCDVDDIKDVIKDVTVYDVDDIMDFTVYDMDDIKDVSDVNDIEDDSTTNTLDSRLLTFTREIFKGQISEAEYEEATVDFPL